MSFQKLNQIRFSTDSVVGSDDGTSTVISPHPDGPVTFP